MLLRKATRGPARSACYGTSRLVHHGVAVAAAVAADVAAEVTSRKRRPRPGSHLDELVRKGVCKLGGTDEGTARNAREAVIRQHELLSSSLSFRLRRSLGLDNVNTPHARFSIPLQLEPAIEALLRDVCSGSPERREFFEELCGLDAVLVELSALLTFPSAPQVSSS